MIKELLSKILSRYDCVLFEAGELTRQREINFEKFRNIMFDDVKRLVDDAVKTDSRVSFEERNGGFWIIFNGRYLFRAAVCVYSDRAEVRIDHHPAVIYNGMDTYELDNYSPERKLSQNIKSHFMTAFERNLGLHLAKEIQKL